MKIVYGSSNNGKVNEVTQFLKNFNIDVIGIKTIIQNIPTIVENGLSYQENALIKCRAFFNFFNGSYNVMADDSGLEVVALNNMPGLFSARYAGENCTPADNRKKLLSALSHISDRTAKFITTIAFIDTNGKEIISQGELLGEIATQEKGQGGFGYDAIFIPKGYNQTLAEIKETNGDFITHRKKAILSLMEHLNITQ